MTSPLTASTGQRLLWLLAQHRDSASLNCPLVCRMTGSLDQNALRIALERLVARHEALRSTLERRGRHLVRLVHAAMKTPLLRLDRPHGSDPEDWIAGELHQELTTPIDVQNSPVRARLWQIDKSTHYFCLNCHHACSDAWTGAIQINDLIALYLEASGLDAPLLPVPKQFSDFVAAEQAYLSGASAQRDRSYWSKALDTHAIGAVPLAPALPGQMPRSARTVVALDRDMAMTIDNMARRHGSTAFAVWLSLYFAALTQVSGRLQVATASLFLNRLGRRDDTIAGYLANLLLLAIEVPAGADIAIVHARTLACVRSAFVHQSYPLHLLAGQLIGAEGRRADEAVFQMLPKPFTRMQMGPVEVELVVPKDVECRFPFELTVVLGDTPEVLVNWDEDRLDRAFVERLLTAFMAKANQLCADPSSLG